MIVVFFANSDVFKFNHLIGSKNFSCFSKRSEMKSTLASAPNASASITSCSISEVTDAPDEIQYNLSFCYISNGLMKPTIASATFTTFASLLSIAVLRQNRPPTYQPWLKLPSQTVLFHGLLEPIFDMRHNY